MPHAVEFSPVVKRLARTGDWQEQRRSTFAVLADAARRNDGEGVHDLAAFALNECRFIYDIMREWQVGLRQYLVDRGTSQDEVAKREERIVGLIAWPDGSPFVHEEGWDRLVAALKRVTDLAERAEWIAAADSAPAALAQWRLLHDREIDWAYGLMSEVVNLLGEEAVPEMFKTIGAHHFEEFLGLADPNRRDWQTDGLGAVMLDTLEAMRAHISSTYRDGSPIEYVEYEDRYVFKFDPCGSGGRAVRGDWVEGTPSRVEPPYNFQTIKGAYDWTDGKKGVCVYCNHCQQIYQQWTIDRAGFPYLVVEPPIYPDNATDDTRQKCTYTVYKDPALVPEEIYRRSGRTKPTHLPRVTK